MIVELKIHFPLKSLNLLLGILLSLSACQYDPFTHNYTTEKPDKSDVIGRYYFERQTIDYQIKEFLEPNSNRIANPMILINPDGTYEFNNIPDFEGILDIEFKGLVNSKGEWNIQTVGTIGDGTGNLQKHWGLVLSGTTENLSRLGFMQGEPPYSLIFGYGDPDEGKAMIFKKN